MKNSNIIQHFPSNIKDTLKYNEKRISLFNQMKEFTPAIRSETMYHSDADYHLQRPFIVMLPNIAFECAKLRENNIDDFDTLREQIETYKYYTQLFMQDFISTCNDKLDQLRSFEKLAKRATKFDINRINYLPFDLIKYIHSYLTSESRIYCYQDITPLRLLETLPMKWIRCIIASCNAMFFETNQRLYLNTDEPTYTDDAKTLTMKYNGYIIRRLRKHMDIQSRKFYLTAKTKQVGVDIIMEILHSWKKMAIRCPTNQLRHIFYTNAFKVFHLLDYALRMKK